MNKEKYIKQVAETTQKAIHTFNDTVSELPELKATELLIILYGVFLDIADTVEQDPDLLYHFMKKEIRYTETADGYSLKFPINFIQGDDE